MHSESYQRAWYQRAMRMSSVFTITGLPRAPSPVPSTVRS